MQFIRRQRNAGPVFLSLTVSFYDSPPTPSVSCADSYLPEGGGAQHRRELNAAYRGTFRLAPSDFEVLSLFMVLRAC